VGGAAAGTIAEMLKYPIQMLHYVELDPMMIEASLPYLAVADRNALDDKRVGLFFKDGRYFVQHGTEKYDMIILNLPDPSTAMLNRFYTLEFFEEAKKRLAPGGVLVTGITGSDTYLGEEVGIYASSLYHTLKQNFSHIVVAPGTKNYFFASDATGVVSADPELLAQRYENRKIASDYFSPYHFSMLFPEERAEFLLRELERRVPVQINTDASPISYYYNLALWEKIAGGRKRASIFQGLTGRLSLLLLTLNTLFLLRVAYILATRKRLAAHLNCNALLAIAAAGFAGMALEIIILFSLQNTYGYVYRQVGLIVAFFMLGLAAGGAQMNRLIANRERNWIAALTLLSIIIGIFAISLPYLIDLFSARKTSAGSSIDMRYVFLGLAAGAGWLTGLEFPLVSKILVNRYETGTVAGWVNGCDHLGACLGALLTGTVLVPVLGMYQSCFITGMLNLMSGALLLIYLLQKGR
jgi:spermidine synthase